MTTVQLRRMAWLNPATPEFLSTAEDVTFVPLEAVWPNGRADFSRRADVADVASGYTRFRAGDVLQPKVTPTFAHGRSTVATIDTHVGAASTEVHVLRAKSHACARYLAYVGQSRPFISEGMTRVEGVGNLLRVPPEFVAQYRLPLMSRTEQEEIADFLDRETAQIDAMIEANEKMISALHERLISERTARNLRLKGASTSHKWFGNVAWEAPKLWRHAKITNGSTPKRERTDYWGGDFPWLNSSVVNLDSVAHADQFVTETALAECHLPIVPAGSVLVGLTGQGRTRGKATELHMTSTINQHMAAVIPDPAFWVSRYLTLSLRSAYEELRRISDANGATKGALTCEALAAFRVPLPPLAEQRRLAVEADTASSKTRNLVESAMRVSVLLRERREALITAAVSGRIDPTTGIERIEEAS